MSFAWIGEVVFGISYFVAWCLGAFKVAHVAGTSTPAVNVFVAISAIAALVFSLALIFENRAFYTNRPRV